MTRIALLSLLVAAGCATPDSGRPPEPAALAAPYPGLVPIGPLLAAGDAARLDDAAVAGVQAEGAALEARGTALRDRPLSP